LTTCPGLKEGVAGEFANLRRLSRSKESNSMKLFIIIVLMCLAGLAWVWPRKVGLKRTTARTWPSGRGRASLKPKLAPR